MIKKGIILAGGMGTRMSPLTKAVNKQLLPIYDKPLIYYPLSLLMLAKIKNILIIVNKGQLSQFKKILPNGNNLGIKITYKEQDKPRGLPDAFILGEKFIEKDNVALILGDNFFYGQNLRSMLLKCSKLKKGAKGKFHKGHHHLEMDINGRDITLTIDTDLQFLASNQCKEAIIETKAERCSFILMNADDGEIYILVEEGESKILPIKLISVRGLYEPGSAFKIFTVGSILDKGEITSDTVFTVADEKEIIDSSNIYVATGGGGWGIMQCFYIGKLIKDLI